MRGKFLASVFSVMRLGADVKISFSAIDLVSFCFLEVLVIEGFYLLKMYMNIHPSPPTTIIIGVQTNPVNKSANSEICTLARDPEMESVITLVHMRQKPIHQSSYRPLPSFYK